jgi:hypothetical protein
MTMKNIVIGLSCYAKIYLFASKQLWPFGLSNARGFLMVHSTNTRLDYACMEVNKLEDWITGILMLLLLLGLALDCCLSLQRFTVLNPRASILFLCSLKSTWTYQPTWSFPPASISLIFQMVTNANMSSNSKKALTVSDKPAIIGSKNYAMDSLLMTSFKVRLINASSFERIVSYSRTLPIVLYLERI